MSLLRLLTAGKSLVGIQDDQARYRVTSQRLLPEFASKRNPFRSTSGPETCRCSSASHQAPASGGLAANETEDSTSETGVQLLTSTTIGPSGTQRLPVVATAPRADTPNRNEGSSLDHNAFITTLIGELAAFARNARNRVVVLVAAVYQSPPLLFVLFANWGSAFWGSAAPKVRKVASRAKAWNAACWGWLPALPGLTPKPARKAIPDFQPPIVQGELSLDRIKVVRNDLSDTDLEIVPAQPSPATAAAARPAAAKRPAKEPAARAEAEPGEGSTPQVGWNRVTERLFGAGQF